MRDRLGRYLILEELGKGGMGIVYRARDERLGKTVALKALAATGPEESDSRKRFRNEARAAAVLNHPAIAGVYDFDEQDGIPFIIYEYVEGKTLDRIIAQGGLTFPQIVDIACQIAAGLAHAHEQGIFHRDIKPQNLMVTAEGRVKILDFGLAKRTRVDVLKADGQSVETISKLTAAGTIVGTVQYMSPEQVGGQALDGRTDIFSLGVVLYEMISGKNPFEADSLVSTIARIVSPELPPLSELQSKVSRELGQTLERCLQKKKEDRFPNAQSLLAELEKIRLGSSSLSGISPEQAEEIQLIPAPVARACLVLLQILYMGIYGFALFYQKDVFRAIANGLATLYQVESLRWIGSFQSWKQVMLLTTGLLITGCCGIAVRLYLLASVAFNDPHTGRAFRKMFPFLFVLDEVWALSPLLLIGKWPEGLTIVCMAVLAYLPFSHRNLVRSAYKADNGESSMSRNESPSEEKPGAAKRLN